MSSSAMRTLTRRIAAWASVATSDLQGRVPRNQLQASGPTPAKFVLCDHTIYFLPGDEQAQALGVPLPRSTRTIWKVLRAHGRIDLELPRCRQPLPPCD